MTAVTIPPEFADLCAARGLTPVQVLAAFMADLAETADSNGSDERAAADAWFRRVVWPEPIRYTLETYLAPSGQWAGIVRADGEEIARIAGCEDADEVYLEANDQWPEIEELDAAR
jgi:hypothetical protein